MGARVGHEQTWIEAHDQANLPTQQPAAETKARLSCSHEDARRTSHLEEPPHQRAGSAVGLIEPRSSVMRSIRSLERSRDFRSLLGHGRRARRDGVTVFARARPDPLTPSRLGVVARTSSRRAVDRNRIKRRLRAAAGESLPPTGYDIVVRGDDQLLGSDFQQLVSDLRGAIERVMRREREP